MLISTILAVAAMLMATGCDQRESRTKRAARFEREASQSLQEACERVVGYRRVLNSSIYRTNDNPAHWTAAATVEFINAHGGVDATNLPFYFRQHAGPDNSPHVQCFLREPTMEEIFDRAYREELKKHGIQ